MNIYIYIIWIYINIRDRDVIRVWCGNGKDVKRRIETSRNSDGTKTKEHNRSESFSTAPNRTMVSIRNR